MHYYSMLHIIVIKSHECNVYMCTLPCPLIVISIVQFYYMILIEIR